MPFNKSATVFHPHWVSVLPKRSKPTRAGCYSHQKHTYTIDVSTEISVTLIDITSLTAMEEIALLNS